MKQSPNLHLNLNLNDSPATDERDYGEQSPLSSPRFNYPGKGILVTSKHPEPGTKYKALKQEVHNIITASRPFRASAMLKPLTSSRQALDSARPLHAPNKFTGSQSHRALSNVGSARLGHNEYKPAVTQSARLHSSQKKLRNHVPAKIDGQEAHLPGATEEFNKVTHSDTGDQLDKRAKLLMMKAAGSVVMPPMPSGKDNYQPNSWNRPSQWTENRLGYSPSNPSLERERNPSYFYHQPPSGRAKKVMHKHQKLFAIQQLLYTTH